MLRRIVLVLALLAATRVWAHEPSRSVLAFTVTGSKLAGRLDVSLRDLEDAVGLDADGDSRITWGEVSAREPEIVAYASPRLRVSAAAGPCSLAIAPNGIDTHGGAAFAVLALSGACESAPDRLRVDYSLLFDIDRAHRAIVTVESAGHVSTAVISNDEQSYTAELERPSVWASVLRFVVEGVWHISLGYDHLAFVVLLVLPILLGRAREGRAPSPRAAAGEILRVVTAFTVAHSLTLALAAAGWVPIPTRAVEIVIAASVLFAAVANVAPRVARLGPKLAFAFGLVHGFGFAGALGELTAGRAALVPALAGFNLGVEIGQLAIVAAVFPVLLALRGSSVLRSAVTFATSTACGALALVWLAERAGL
jgi:HupE/UreJ protein